MAEDAARACNVPPEQGLWKAHNLIEMSFERRLYVQSPQLGECLAVACADAALIGRIAASLAQHFGAPVQALTSAMLRFPEVVQLRPSSTAALGETYALQTRLRHPGSQPDAVALASLIERAEAITAGDGDSFLVTCVERVGTMVCSTLG